MFCSSKDCVPAGTKPQLYASAARMDPGSGRYSAGVRPLTTSASSVEELQAVLTACKPASTYQIRQGWSHPCILEMMSALIARDCTLVGTSKELCIHYNLQSHTAAPEGCVLHDGTGSSSSKSGKYDRHSVIEFKPKKYTPVLKKTDANAIPNGSFFPSFSCVKYNKCNMFKMMRARHLATSGF